MNTEQSYYTNGGTLDTTCSFISEQINAELENLKKGKNISVLAKWLPKPNATAERKRRLARLIAEKMNMSEPAYRKMISGLRAHLNLLETSLTTGSYDFDYSSIPSQAMLKHSGLASRFSKHKVNAFKREDADRYKEYILSLKSGKAKVNVTTLNPVQVYKRAFAQRELSQRQWEQIEKRIPMTDKKIIVVRDGSASMIGEPMDVATSLTILASSRLTGEFKDKFITFSHAPKLVDLSGLSTLQAKIGKCMRETDCTNTNIEATYDLILETSKGCKPEDYITDVVVISDMQFTVRVEQSS